jgi:phage tail sheath protein FI
MKTSGLPGTNVDVVDFSTLLPNNIQGKIGVMIFANRGRINIPVFCPTWADVLEEFGNITSDDNSMLELYRAILAGAKPYVVRVGHYTDITDKTTLAGTKATVTVGGIVFRSLYAGAGYNGATVKIVAAKSGLSNAFDITFTLENAEDQTIYDVINSASVSQIASYNLKLSHFQIVSVPTTITVATGTFASGALAYNTIVDQDYIGNETEELGWFAFNNISDIFRIYNLDRPVPAVDAALIAYAEKRGDIRVRIRVPVGANDIGMKDYRMGTGSYTHQAFDSWYASIVAGDIDINHPNDSSIRKIINGIGDVAGIVAVSDQENGVWFAAAGGQRGKLKNTNGVPYNLGASIKATKADDVYEKGINLIINHEAFGPVYWGNRSLLRDQTKLLRFDNVCDLAMYIKISLKPLVQIENFNPNDPQMFSSIYRRVRPFILELERKRAIYPESDTEFGWKWIGDQNADTLADVKYNVKADVLAGKYKAMFAFVPITANEYINITAAVTDNTASIIVN